MNGYLGTIMLFAGKYAPMGWLPCDGRELQITSYLKLFSIITTEYGGDGAHTFALPKLNNLSAATNKDKSGPIYIICCDGDFPGHP